METGNPVGHSGAGGFVSFDFTGVLGLWMGRSEMSAYEKSKFAIPIVLSACHPAKANRLVIPANAKRLVIPAKAGIHLQMVIKYEWHGFPPSRE